METASLTFTPFPKIGRLEKDMIVTEKLDGTNAAVVITEEGVIYAQSRKRFITPDDDNYGFAAWVQDNEYALEALGPGVHFGEWWGRGVQRGYGLAERRFSLFNTGRWSSLFNAQLIDADNPAAHVCIECRVCHVVPILEVATFDTVRALTIHDLLRSMGSFAAPGFDNPEGVVVFHTAQGHLYKLSDAKAPPDERRS